MASTMSLDQAAHDAPSLARLVAEAEVGGPPPDDDIPLYAPRRKIYPQSVHGLFRKIKWVVLVLTLGVYYLTPFIRWDRGPNAPIAGGADRFSQPPVLFLLRSRSGRRKSTTSPGC